MRVETSAAGSANGREPTTGTMQAIVRDRYADTEVLRLDEVPRPVPGDHDVVVRVAVAGLDRGAWHWMTGLPYLKGAVMSQRKIAVAVGFLFFVQMITYMLGDRSIQAFENGETTSPPTTGVLLTMLSGLAIVAIGLLMYPVLKQVDRRLAIWYPVMRVVEFAVSAACGVYLLTQLQVVPNSHLWVYLPTGIGGLVLTYLLFVSRLVPRPIAVLGIVGYASLLLGVLLDLLGVLDMTAGAGMVLLVPGGLFEFAVLPIWLIAKGFSSTAAAVPTSATALVPAS